jgi:60 kDa SS-A/Ro ribonucleoprotein
VILSQNTSYVPAVKLPQIVEAFEKAKMASSKGEIVGLINAFDLPREAIPTQWLNEVAVWDARLQYMPLTALVRNLGKMSAVGLAKPSTLEKITSVPHPSRPGWLEGKF